MLPINVIVEILEKALDFTNNVVKSFNDEEYANAVNKIFGHEPNYSELDALSNVILNSTDISIEKKQELIFAISDKKRELQRGSIEHKEKCAKIINKGFEKRGKVILKIALGVFTGGVSAIPDLCSAISRKVQENKLTDEPRNKE